MDANEKIRLIKEQALKAKALQEQEKQPTTVIPVTNIVEKEEAVKDLPAPFKPTKFLSVSRKGGTSTVQDLVQKFAIEPEVYEAIEVTEEQGAKINKSLGRMVTGVAAAVPIVCRGDGCSYKEACVTGDTLVMTVKGLKAIRDINVNDKIYSINTQRMLIERDTVTAKTITENQPVYCVKTQSGNKIKLTSNHPVLTKTEGGYKWRTLDTGLSVGSQILVTDGETDTYFNDSVGDLLLDTVTRVEYVGTEDVYDITVYTNSNFVANNIVVHNCPFYEENVHVVGEKCPIEVSLIEAWAQDFMDELRIDPNSITEIQILSRLIEISILERRLTVYISLHDQDLTTEFVASVDPMGNEIKNKGPSIAFEQREKLDRAKMKLLESLNATRDRKLKIQSQIQQEAKVDSSMLEIRNSVIDIAKALKMQNVVGEG